MKSNMKILFGLGPIAASLVLTSCGGGGSCPTPTSRSLDIEYTVTLNPCFEDGEIQRVIGKAGAEVALPDGPSRSGFKFVSWSEGYNKETKMGDASKAISGKIYTVPSNNKVLYGIYEKAELPVIPDEELDKYYQNLSKTSKDGHLYVHYFRWEHNEDDYKEWDIWAWPYRPSEGEGYKFDYSGMDDYGGAIYDIDLTKEYDGGWNNKTKTIGGTPVSFYADEDKTTLDTQVGVQIVKSETRKTGGGFWTNDGSNLYVNLSKLEIEVNGGGKAYHLFALQDGVQDYQATPLKADDRVDPFAGDTGENVTKGKSTYDNADWNDKEIMGTAPDFKNIGAGYQIMVSSFADSDGDGFGDIYGITQKLDYLDKLGVKALWLTPIQKSDSYHGYDISDYDKVDPKFGSATSPNAFNGEVTEESAMKDYEDLIKEANKKGMKIVMDLVLNHTSTSNAWFIKSAKLNPEYRGYYQWANHVKDSSINEEASWYPYGDHDYSYYAKFGSGMPELNFSYQATRDAVEEMTLRWCERGVSGFRLDAVKHIFMRDECNIAQGDTIVEDVSYDEKLERNVDYSSDLTKNLNFYKELNHAVKSKYPNAFFVGENFDGTAYAVGPYYEAFDSMFDFYTYFNLTSIAAGTSVGGYASGFMRGSSQYQGKGKEYNGHSNMKWNAVDVFKNYDQWRGDSALPGCFTSNHDIARVINRIGGTGDSTGIQAQGEVTTSTFPALNKKAMCVKLAEIFMPGLTWVYYGDEIGMTGNFLLNATHAKDDYADLAYRQPMKWVANGTTTDGSMTTSYSINGAKTNIYHDDVNSSPFVVPANTQVNDPNSDFSILAKAIKLKNEHPASLITGSFEDNNTQDRVLSFKRSGGGETITVDVAFDNAVVTVKKGSTVLFEYHG